MCIGSVIQNHVIFAQKATEADNKMQLGTVVTKAPSNVHLQSLRQSALERLFSAAAGADEAAQGRAVAVMRSNTMENILRTMSGARELDELMFDWSSLPQDVSTIGVIAQVIHVAGMHAHDVCLCVMVHITPVVKLQAGGSS